ncbi:MAG: hypothetical protein ACRD0U_04930, partial [Acidimicrobiales bacterium]
AELFEMIENIGSNMWEEHYAVGFNDQMNEDGIRAIVGVIETFAAHQRQSPTDDDGRIDPAPDLGDIAERLLDPMVHGFAIASGSVDLTEEREALLNPGDDPNSDARWKQHQLAMLLTDEGHNYDSTFLADAADVILVSNKDVNWINRDNMDAYDTDYPAMYMGPDIWEGHPELSVPQVIAMQALADNPDASWDFTGRGDEHLEVVVRPDAYEIQDLPFEMTSNGYSYDDAERLREMMEQAGADIVTAGFVDAVRDDPTRYTDALDRYADVVRIVGDGDIPDVTKRTVANALGLYVNDIGEAALRQSETHYENDDAKAAEDFNRPDLVDFFEELGYDEEAAGQVGESITVWASQEAQPFVGDTHLQQGEINQAFRPVALVMGTIEDGFNATDDAMQHAYDGFAAGVVNGGGIVSAVGLAAIPATGGASLLVAGAGAVAGPLLEMGGDLITSQAEGAAIDGDNFETIVLQQLREELAIAVASDQGLPTPHPGEYASTLDAAYPETGDPFDYVDLRATDEQHDYDDDDHWSALPDEAG